MKITVDTNVLLRLVVSDDVKQRGLAQRALDEAETAAVTLPALCELVWVLQSSYGAPKSRIASAIRVFMNTHNIVMNRPAVEAGLRMLDAGGDFADGVIAYDGQWLGGETFVSFDKQAVKLLQGLGNEAVLLP